MSEPFFEVGGRYRNREDSYEVISINGDKMIVQLEDGTTKIMSIVIQERIVSNIQSEEARLLPAKIKDNDPKNFAWTLGALARLARLEAEVPPKAWKGFVRSYFELTGVTLVADSKHVFLLKEDSNKWGPELRIYLPEMVSKHERFSIPEGLNLVSGFQPGEVRINSNLFWWHLVDRCSFKIGSPQDPTAISNRLSPDLQGDFREGLDFATKI